MSDILDFAIVGGGASGVYSAWRIAHASQDEVTRIREKIGGEGALTITVFERTHRIGGRLLSASPDTLPQNAMELGGMRYLTSQPLVTALVEKKLKLKEQGKTYQQAVDEPGNFAYLRRRIFRQSELDLPATELPYDLTEAERLVVTDPGTKASGGDGGGDEDDEPKPRPATLTPAQLIFWAVFQEFPELDGMPHEEMEEFLQKAEVDGKPLFQWGFWNLLSRHLSHEGRQLGITAIGYDVLGANANAVDIISENFDFQATSKYYLFRDGYESVLWELADQFEGPDRAIHVADDASDRSTTLESFDSTTLSDGGDGFELTFEDGSTVEARAVVLAMPKWAIQALRKKGPVLDPDRAPAKAQTNLNAVEGIPLYKLFMIYPRPWWQEKWGLRQGRSVTDIPVRQCYYWATSEDGGPSAIMAYNDQASTSFWGGYQTGPLGPLDTGQGAMLFHPEHEVSGQHEDPLVERRRKNWDDHKAPHEMVVEMHRQLMEMHGVDDAPEPIDAAFMDWMNPPYGGAVHFWNPGHKSWEVKDEMTQPVEGCNAFIVGEAWSTVQTWVEGALQTSEIFLQKRLGMKPPDWVEGDQGL